MTSAQTNFYAEWRARQHSRLLGTFQETPQSPPPERLLQTIWHHQRLLRDQLKLSDGRALKVLHPGFWNREAGPDFRGAVLQIDSETPRAGDVEVDIHSSGWRAHGHDRNPNFKNVALHVVWEGDRRADTPTLSIKSFLDAPLPELAQWLGSESAQGFPEELAGRCCAPLQSLPVEKLADLLQQAALVRLQRKAADLEARARQTGWDQVLWEGLLRALGYKYNAWPLQCLAELRSRLVAGENLSLLQLQARLLGVGGLLPAELTRTRAGTDQYIRQVWDFWWRDRETFQDCTLPRKLWHFGGLRPANHPQRRLALVAHWWNDKNFIGRLKKWFTAGHASEVAPAALLGCLQSADDPFWSRHWTFRSAPLTKPQPLLGATRVTDLAINVVLPWFWVRSREGKNESLCHLAEQYFFAWPKAEDNSVLRLARERLLGGATPRSLKGAAAQQGLLQIVRDFCANSNALCEDCPFPGMVRDWSGKV